VEQFLCLPGLICIQVISFLWLKIDIEARNSLNSYPSLMAFIPNLGRSSWSLITTPLTYQKRPRSICAKNLIALILSSLPNMVPALTSSRCSSASCHDHCYATFESAQDKNLSSAHTAESRNSIKSLFSSDGAIKWMKWPHVKTLFTER
jgi:hypothetical protein